MNGLADAIFRVVLVIGATCFMARLAIAACWLREANGDPGLAARMGTAMIVEWVRRWLGRLPVQTQEPARAADWARTASYRPAECCHAADEDDFGGPCWGNVDIVYTEAGLAGYYCQGHRDLPDPDVGTIYTPSPTPEERAAAYDAKVAEYHASGQYEADMQRIGVLAMVDGRDARCICAKTAVMVTTKALSPITGHLESCPVHARILADYPKAAVAVETASPVVRPEDEPEDHTTTLWLWTDGAGMWRFEPPPSAAQCIEVSAPVGWSLVPDESEGVVLRNVFGLQLSAAWVADRARNRLDGFRVR